MEVLRLWTAGSAWFSGEEPTKGRLTPGQLADVAVLSADYFSVPGEQIKGLESVITLVGGKVVHGSGEFATLAPPLPPASPSWSPVADSSSVRGAGASRLGALGVLGRHEHGSGSAGCGCSAV